MIARKRFGQNFLKDTAVIQAIIQAIHPQAGQHLVEIGPGHGALTRPILNTTSKLTFTVIEIDRDLVHALKTWPCDLNIIEADALTIDYSQLSASVISSSESQRSSKPSLAERLTNPKIRLFGNLPYNISTPLLLHVLSFTPFIQDMHFMVQKEVAERITASPGNKNYGRLSVMTQYFCQTELLFSVNPDAFVPKPKVDSSIIRLSPYQIPFYPPIAFEKLESVVKQAFSQRRKTLKNNFKHTLSEQDWKMLNIDSTLRPEQLEVIQFISIAQFLFKC